VHNRGRSWHWKCPTIQLVHPLRVHPEIDEHGEEEDARHGNQEPDFAPS
jgi:hypothetical protein